MKASALYEGWVNHRRLDPVEHEFRYPIFMVYLDLDELPGSLDAVLDALELDHEYLLEAASSHRTSSTPGSSTRARTRSTPFAFVHTRTWPRCTTKSNSARVRRRAGHRQGGRPSSRFRGNAPV